MSTEQLTGLQLAVKLLAQIGDDDSDRAIAAVHDLAEAHAQRLTLQHHAADQVWRIADLEVKCCTLKELHDAAADERDALRVKVSDLERAAVKRREISDGVEAELVDECDTLRTLKSKTESERDELAIGMQALRARLAEIEAQEPAIVEAGELRVGFGDTEEAVWLKLSRNIPLGTELFTRPVPAQAVPRSDKQLQEITLNAAQLRNALEFIAPDFDSDADQHKSEVTICWREAGTVVDDDGKPEPAGYVAWLSDYPEEGCIPLLESFESNPAPAQAAPDGWRLVPVEPTEKMVGEGACASCLPGPHYIGSNAARAAYQNMIAAAPEHKA